MSKESRRTCEPLHASMWKEVRKSCGWVMTQWREKSPAECRYPFCSCVQVVAIEDRVTVAIE
jgi:hypothetical protein